MRMETIIAVFLGAFLMGIGGLALFRITKDYREDAK